MIFSYRYGTKKQTHHYLPGGGLVVTYNATATATVLATGLVSIAFTSKKPGITFTSKKPSIIFS